MNPEERDFTYGIITVFWERYSWQPLRNHTVYYSPNKKYKALVNESLGVVSLIFSKNGVEECDRRGVVALMNLLLVEAKNDHV